MEQSIKGAIDAPEGSAEAAHFSEERQYGAVALDCEMVGGGSDGSINICARVCLVDEDENVLLNTYVQPLLPVTDYRCVILLYFRLPFDISSGDWGAHFFLQYFSDGLCFAFIDLQTLPVGRRFVRVFVLGFDQLFLGTQILVLSC